MMDFIRADFYRLMRSKGFWITEFFFILCDYLNNLLPCKYSFWSKYLQQCGCYSISRKTNRPSSSGLFCRQHRQSVIFHYYWYQYGPWSGPVSETL